MTQEDRTGTYVEIQYKCENSLMEDFTLDTKKLLNEMMPNIHTNNNIPQDIKDAWIELCVVENSDLIIEEVIVA